MVLHTEVYYFFFLSRWSIEIYILDLFLSNEWLNMVKFILRPRSVYTGKVQLIMFIHIDFQSPFPSPSSFGNTWRSSSEPLQLYFLTYTSVQTLTVQFRMVLRGSFRRQGLKWMAEVIVCNGRWSGRGRQRLNSNCHSKRIGYFCPIVLQNLLIGLSYFFFPPLFDIPYIPYGWQMVVLLLSY